MVKELKLIEGVLDIVLSTVLFLFILVIFGYSQNNSEPQRVPSNPEFLKCIESKRKGHLKQISEDGKLLGYVSSFIRLPEENVSLKEILSDTQLQSLPSRVETIKNADYQYGAVYPAFKQGSNYYNTSSYSFSHFYAGTPNHGMVKERFKVQPPGNGAFIVKNSWGTDWEKGGYLYLSYYDRVLCKAVSFYLAETPNNYRRIYQYEPLGCICAFSYEFNPAWMSNIFIAGAKVSSLRTISLCALSNGTPYRTFVHDNVVYPYNLRLEA